MTDSTYNPTPGPASYSFIKNAINLEVFWPAESIETAKPRGIPPRAAESRIGLPLVGAVNIFASFSPIIFLMPDANDLHRVYMYFQDCGGWQCQFLEADLQTSLRRQLHFASSDKLVEFVERGGGFKDQEARMMLDQGTGKGRGGVFLSLTDEQYAELNR